jgi:hypothetical protein
MFLLLSIALAITPHYFSIIAAYGQEQEDDNNDGDNDNDDDINNSASEEEDFEEQNSIQICCAWDHNLADGILTYYIDKENSNKQQQHEVRNAVQEWDGNIDSLELEETSSKKNGDILIEFQREYEGYGNDDNDEEIAGQSVNTFDNKGFIDKVHIIVYKGTSDYKFDEGIVELIVKHEMGHALGLGHANFSGDLMAEKVNDGTDTISECEIKAVLQANHWKLITDGMQPDMPKRNGIVCSE